MDRDNSTEIRQQITIIASRFKMFECVECAQTVKKFLIESKIVGKQIKLYTGSTEGYYGNIYHDGIQAVISTNGRHEGILIELDIQEIVFDNIDNQGVTKEVWLQNLYSPILDIGEEFQVTEIDF
ncbi:papain fold toxin domain-containing protein [Rivularia sp. UHCC 0363]|uniref:papain fold toxin domain-containing protein n=1 Tax=Rivularia sp. UHCC 0363 TaxID=3110244 RepID=UPI002B1EE3AB|nr:papain fold toxin domain-containing protein [Rivularia sp. UHCC 0363]MEA5593713.1 papain fold toxin domain-containing protein [Rivularia sp. UHCC 0363]